MEYAFGARKETCASMIPIAILTYIASGDQMQDTVRAYINFKIKVSTANPTIGAMPAWVASKTLGQALP